MFCSQQNMFSFYWSVFRVWFKNSSPSYFTWKQNRFGCMQGAILGVQFLKIFLYNLIGSYFSFFYSEHLLFTCCLPASILAHICLCIFFLFIWFNPLRSSQVTHLTLPHLTYLYMCKNIYFMSPDYQIIREQFHKDKNLSRSGW